MSYGHVWLGQAVPWTQVIFSVHVTRDIFLSPRYFCNFHVGKGAGGKANLRILYKSSGLGKIFCFGSRSLGQWIFKKFYLLIFFGNRKKFVLFVGLFKDVKEEPQILSQTQGFCPNTNILSQYPSSLPNLLGMFQKIQFLTSCVCFRSF